MCSRVLVSDIDGTLLKESEPTAGLDTLRRMLEQNGRETRIVYATGRTIESVIELVETQVLPGPDAVAPLVGTEIWQPPFKEPNPVYAHYIGEDWDRDALVDLASGMEELELQPDRYQSAYKLSFFVDSESAVDALRARLDESGLRCKVIHSAGRYLDLIPSRAGKRAAAEFVIKRWNIADALILAAGDSLNDKDLLTTPRFYGVVVGNSDDGLSDEVNGP
jgi:sucrose-6F-phosphate phosphohydrolase